MEPLNPWFGKAAILGIIAAIVVIRAPFGSQSRKNSYRGETIEARARLLSLHWHGLEAWSFHCSGSFLRFSRQPNIHSIQPFSQPVSLVAASGLWLFRRSHIELGKNWSISLDLREGHQLVTSGLYRHVRHPMYASIFLYAVGQALVVPNWIVGPANLVAFFVLFAVRVQSEEQMMADKFGDQYRNYMAKTKRLIPGIW